MRTYKIRFLKKEKGEVGSDGDITVEWPIDIHLGEELWLFPPSSSLAWLKPGAWKVVRVEHEWGDTSASLNTYGGTHLSVILSEAAQGHGSQ